MEKENYTYIVRCRDGTLYTGWTTHLQERVDTHNAGKGAKYTKSRRPVELVYYETFETKQEAMRREWELKHWTKEQKEALVSGEISGKGNESPAGQKVSETGSEPSADRKTSETENETLTGRKVSETGDKL